jgi:hypothetical protein
MKPKKPVDCFLPTLPRCPSGTAHLPKSDLSRHHAPSIGGCKMRDRIRDRNPIQEALRLEMAPRSDQIVVQAWKTSGQTMDEFTEKHDLRFDRLNNWAQRFHREKRAGSPEKLTFGPVTIPDQAEAPRVTGREAMHIARPTGIRGTIFSF